MLKEPRLRRQTLLRLVLLVALTFGVFGMHTFGHPSDLVSPGVGHMTSAVHTIEDAPAPAQGHHGSHGRKDGLHAFTVCLAVLGGVLVLGSLSLLRHRRWDLCVPAGPRSWATGRRRAPSHRPIGLHLTAVSVMRT
ncbi:hypothetical protein GCM10010169_49420 [Micromonospora fulviviridis]|uniref:DUF6153 family protein n=1 Tax=Micromonospora fulviviridis TaxID=47860 RepID=UPI0019CA335F|nr:DUF6153 family protein [Micromonospora fulviviridis]GGR98927.1 hypothetical protein GCM10010169_49420 [Micromonospora fulviviridis]